MVSTNKSGYHLLYYANPIQSLQEKIEAMMYNSFMSPVKDKGQSVRMQTGNLRLKDEINIKDSQPNNLNLNFKKISQQT